MSTPRVELVLRQLESLPPLPAVAMKVLQATSREASDAREVARLVESDPALAAAVMRSARRAGVASRDVTDVGRAVVVLGFAEVRACVLAQGVLSTFPATATAGDVPDAGRIDFWTHGLAVAVAAERLATLVGKSGRFFRRSGDAAEAFTCGLLHDLGKLALHSVLPKSYARVVAAVKISRGDVSDTERGTFGLDHATAGKRLAEKWNLPAAVRDAIWLHNQHPEAVPEQAGLHAALVCVVSLADRLARRLRLGYSGNHAAGVATSAYLDRLGLTAADLESVAEGLVEAVASRASSLGLGDGEAAGLYRSALRRAEAELSARPAPDPATSSSFAALGPDRPGASRGHGRPRGADLRVRQRVRGVERRHGRVVQPPVGAVGRGRFDLWQRSGPSSCGGAG